MARHPPPRAGAVPGRGPHDNGVFRPHRDVPFSRVIEIERASGTIAWEYHDPARESFFAPFMGSAQRLPNGNTLVTDSPAGRLFETNCTDDRAGGTRHNIHPARPVPPLFESSHTAYDDGMNRLSERIHRRVRGTCTSAVLGWLFVLLAMVSCCSITAPAAHGSAPHPATVARTITPTHHALARIVVADAPEDRGTGSSCRGPSEHSTPVVLPGQSAPAALPGTPVAVPVAPLTGAAAIRGPSNDAVREVDHLRLQVQRI
ncbi:hypothetical protein [Streptomyces sp. NBC_00012]|uniref:hypothetical protein n=1 Tax=Streptomyces sp. NBC_00012 TaxID=2975621 RepID=UPI00386CF014